jgi:hypothetical protein
MIGNGESTLDEIGRAGVMSDEIAQEATNLP